jgi:hypothetical protein
MPVPLRRGAVLHLVVHVDPVGLMASQQNERGVVSEPVPRVRGQVIHQALHQIRRLGTCGTPGQREELSARVAGLGESVGVKQQTIARPEAEPQPWCAPGRTRASRAAAAAIRSRAPPLRDLPLRSSGGWPQDSTSATSPPGGDADQQRGREHTELPHLEVPGEADVQTPGQRGQIVTLAEGEHRSPSPRPGRHLRRGRLTGQDPQWAPCNGRLQKPGDRSLETNGSRQYRRRPSPPRRHTHPDRLGIIPA